jgi:hypothetical protein
MMLAATGETGGAGCRFGAPPGTFCQGLEIAALVWSDRQRCSTSAVPVERPRRLSIVRRSAQGCGDRASGGGFGLGA